MLRPFGFGDYDQGARASQIRDDLLHLDRATPRDMLTVQLDDRALFLARWRDLAMHTLDVQATRDLPTRREFRRLLAQTWSGRASIDSVGYRMVKAFRGRVAALALDPLYAPLAQTGRLTPVAARSGTSEGPLWALVSGQPAHLLSDRYASWRALLLDAVDWVATSLTANGRAMADRTWGELNTARIRHPLSAALPSMVGRFLDMPADRLPGDGNMPRVQSPGFGASERFAVTPGREREAYFHMPGGQSGHPLSPHSRDGHAAWVRGEPTPFLPGPTVHVLTFRPR
jgi:penicillin amidase